MQTHRLIEKEWRKVINQAFILKEHRAQRQILLKLEIICFFFFPPSPTVLHLQFGHFVFSNKSPHRTCPEIINCTFKPTFSSTGASFH